MLDHAVGVGDTANFGIDLIPSKCKAIQYKIQLQIQILISGQ